MTTSYEGASAHYLSPDRRDAVKRHWEEPVNHRILARALAVLPDDRPVRVTDVGSGTGDGLALLEVPLGGRPLAYTGIDPDPEMVATASAAHRHRDDVTFRRADVRDEHPALADTDLWLSAGAPWSHLHPDEFRTTLVRILRTAARRDRPTAVVVDVLGRYSVEWVPRWGADRWDYRMSFFQGAGEDDAIAAPMSVHTRSSLDEVLREAGVGVRTVEYHDRSVLVGRHTTTAAFHPGLPNYRGMVNALFGGDVALDLGDLHVHPPAGDAPAEVAAFFAAYLPLWNGTVERALEGERLTGVRADGRVALAQRLCALEHGAEQGLGAGHSLIGLVVVEPS